MTERTKWYCPNLDNYKTNQPDDLVQEQLDDKYNLVSSLLTNGKHAPALDIDIPCRIVESSTEGHCHIYFDDLEMSWEKYEKLLIALSDAGIIEENYLKHSQKRKATMLRPEHVKKVKKPEPSISSNNVLEQLGIAQVKPWPDVPHAVLFPTSKLNTIESVNMVDESKITFTSSVIVPVNTVSEALFTDVEKEESEDWV
jgi:hypothetical protein